MHYGWSVDERAAARKRGISHDRRFDSLIGFDHSARWAIRVQNGVHTVTIGVGDPRWGAHYTLTAEGHFLWHDKWISANSARQITTKVDVQDHLLTLTSGAAPDMATRIDFITIDNAGSPPGCTYPTPSPGHHHRHRHHHRYRHQVGARPYGLSGLKRVFGRPCSGRANNARTWFPSARGRGIGGYVLYNARLARKVHHIARSLRSHHHGKEVNYGVYGYACRVKRGGTSWSVHSWGAAIDTNSLLNPMGRHHWNGTGSNGHHYGKLIPKTWQRRGFYWGLHFGDPMHFQYVSGY